MVAITSRIKGQVYNLAARVHSLAEKHPSLARALVINAGSIPVALASLVTAGGIPVLIGSCASMRENLERIKKEMNLPEKINTQMTTELIDKIATPFELKMRDRIRDIAFDEKDGRIKNPEITGESIEHLVDKHVLFEMISEINSDPNKTFDPRKFKKEYLQKLAEEMKEEYFENEAITVPELMDIIKKVEIEPGKNVGDSVVDWIERNNIFEEPTVKSDQKATDNARKDSFAFTFKDDGKTTDHGGGK